VFEQRPDLGVARNIPDLVVGHVQRLQQCSPFKHRLIQRRDIVQRQIQTAQKRRLQLGQLPDPCPSQIQLPHGLGLAQNIPDCLFRQRIERQIQFLDVDHYAVIRWNLFQSIP
jgi:hypothetical protein